MDLPEEMVAEILSRIPIKDIFHCGRVCKRWHSILSKPYYANMHSSKSPSCLMVHEYMDDVLKLGQLEDEFDRHDISHDPAMRFDLGLGTWEATFLRTINGLLCIWLFRDNEATCICNPVKREYTLLPNHKYIRKKYNETSNIRITCGFGFVEASNQYKVVRIYQGKFPFPDGSYKSECEIYMLGTCNWRSLGHVPFEVYRFDYENITRQKGIFANGNLHWLAFDVEDNTNQVLCTFDLEKESFQLTTATPQIGGNVTYKRTLGVLGGCLCLCDSTSDSKSTIWVMKDYGMKESWSKEIVFIRDESIADCFSMTEMVHVIKFLKDGTILMLFWEKYFFTYHPGNKTLKKLDSFYTDLFDNIYATVHTPSFIRLKSIMLEKVAVF